MVGRATQMGHSLNDFRGGDVPSAVERLAGHILQLRGIVMHAVVGANGRHVDRISIHIEVLGGWRIAMIVIPVAACSRLDPPISTAIRSW